MQNTSLAGVDICQWSGRVVVKPAHVHLYELKLSKADALELAERFEGLSLQMEIVTAVTRAVAEVVHNELADIRSADAE